MIRKLLLLVVVCIFMTVSCSTLSDLSFLPKNPTPTPLPKIPVVPGGENPDEPVFITGDIPYTSPFFINTLSQPFVMLEDQTGFVNRDKDFQFPVQSQTLGPVTIHEDESLSYSLSLPAIPQGTQIDLDNDGEDDPGVQVFAAAYWSNTWGDPFLEERDGTGWSNAHSSAMTDPDNENEISGGVLIVWAPDDRQGFPVGFGEDGLLFTVDDPVEPIPAGYNIVDLDQEPFRIYKEAEPQISLIEGVGEVNDFSEMDYKTAFSSLYEKVSKEYPFTVEKKIDWDALHEDFSTRLEGNPDEKEFYETLQDFTYEIPDDHVGLSFNPEVFNDRQGGGFGLVLAELTDSKIIVKEIIPESPADNAGIKKGAQVLSWDGKPVITAIEDVEPYFGPFSSNHKRRIDQVNSLIRVPPNKSLEISFQNPGSSPEAVTLKAVNEYESLFKTFPEFQFDEIALPIEGHILDDSGLGYLRINTFSTDYHLMASLWDHYIQGLIDEEVPGLIIDLRTNGGGSLGLAQNFAGYFFDEEIPLFDRLYYNNSTSDFESTDHVAKIEPGPKHYEGEIAILVGPDCISACEGFAYAMKQNDRSIVIGHYPTAGAFGEVGRGQYKLPDEITMQFPTGRPETPEGELLLEGTGVTLDITVPVTAESAMGSLDTILQAAIEALQDRIR